MVIEYVRKQIITNINKIEQMTKGRVVVVVVAAAARSSQNHLATKVIVMNYIQYHFFLICVIMRFH